MHSCFLTVSNSVFTTEGLGVAARGASCRQLTPHGTEGVFRGNGHLESPWHAACGSLDALGHHRLD